MKAHKIVTLNTKNSEYVNILNAHLATSLIRTIENLEVNLLKKYYSLTYDWIDLDSSGSIFDTFYVQFHFKTVRFEVLTNLMFHHPRPSPLWFFY